MITDYKCFWPTETPRCEVLTCLSRSTHALQMDNDVICLCDFHIGKFAQIARSVSSADVQVSVHKIGNVEVSK